jgi:N-ethylmaleimide reductase
MSTSTEAKLFTPVSFGPMRLKHRVVMAPLTRSRASQRGSIPGDLMVEYYSQRASDGGFIVSEATNISASARGWLGAPGLYTDEQVQGWRKVTNAVHKKGGHMFAQLWHTGRSSHIDTAGQTPVSASVNPEYMETSKYRVSTPSGWIPPSMHRALSISEIKQIIEDYRLASARALDAGFEGVEFHGGNGYLIDQFLQDSSNKRMDEYGGSIVNRTRFLMEVVAAVCTVWGGDHVAVRIAPSGTWNGMGDSNADALFSSVAGQLNQFNLAYLHVIEPRVKGSIVTEEGQGPVGSERLRKIFKGKIIAAGGFEPTTAEETVRAGIADAVAFGRHFVSNPDLPHRIHEHLPLTPYDRDTFYTFDERGYTDYLAALGRKSLG